MKCKLIYKVKEYFHDSEEDWGHDRSTTVVQGEDGQYYEIYEYTEFNFSRPDDHYKWIAPVSRTKYPIPEARRMWTDPGGKKHEVIYGNPQSEEYEERSLQGYEIIRTPFKENTYEEDSDREVTEEKYQELYNKLKAEGAIGEKPVVEAEEER